MALVSARLSIFQMKEYVHRNYEKRYGQESKEADSGANQAHSLGDITLERIQRQKFGRTQQALENEEMMTGEGYPEFLLFCGVENGST